MGATKKRNKTYRELEFFFSEQESLSHQRSNFGDMVSKMAGASDETYETDAHGSYDHQNHIKGLPKIGALRRIRARLLRCSEQTVLTFSLLFSEPALMAEVGSLERFVSIHDDHYSPIAKAYYEYRKAHDNADGFWLLTQAKNLNTPPDRLLRLAWREYETIKRLTKAGL